MSYTIEVINKPEQLDKDFIAFFCKAARSVSSAYDNKFDWTQMEIVDYAGNGLILVCRRDGVLVAAVLARLLRSVFDRSKVILYQDLLYAGPDAGRAAHLLMRTLIDFGKTSAHHLITCVGEKTNIKGRSLERLGFKKLETLYRMEF